MKSTFQHIRQKRSGLWMAGILGCAASIGMSGCTNLDEKVYSSVTKESFFNSKEEVIANYIRPYSHIVGSYQYRIWHLNTLTTDEAAMPYRDGTPPADGGDQIVGMHWHTWTPDDSEIKNTWDAIYRGVGLTNSTLENMEFVNFQKLNVGLDKEMVLAEMHCYRAWYYWLLMDMWGNIPISEKVGEPMYPETRPRKEVFAYIEKEVLNNVDKLLDKGAPNTYGHMTKPAAWALLAKLYLNAQVYGGTLTENGLQPGPERWDDCITYCDKVINYTTGGGYQLDANWNDPFKIKNELSKENIFVVVYDTAYATEMRWNYKVLHQEHQKTYGFSWTPQNRFMTHNNFFGLFGATDKRKAQWLYGPQFAADGVTPLKCLSGAQKGKPLVLDPYFVNAPGDTATMLTAKEFHGARNVKFEFQKGSRISHMSNDAPVYRLSDVMMMKAEAIMRKNGGTATPEAVNLVNAVRKRAFAAGDPKAEYTVATLTLDELLNERAREFAWEGWRRNDLIRFGKFTNPGWDKKQSEPWRIVFPIPNNTLSVNPNLKQNPGY
ncbi:RagB/SusD family nutrient uptake outer membrane protein [Chitinophaga sp.]|uniref:RagB/SusD family nutrient uptake outer membrane protein n=1 Tax=Chitinophaga sp. TaxID=1869181 RepID=UPI0031D8FFED